MSGRPELGKGISCSRIQRTVRAVQGAGPTEGHFKIPQRSRLWGQKHALNLQCTDWNLEAKKDKNEERML